MTPDGLLAEARERRAFSAAAWSVGTADVTFDRGVLGTLRWDGPAVTERSAWDLASLTKPMVGLVVMRLVETGPLTLRSTVGEWLPRFAGTDKSGLTVGQLLTHTSGLPGGTPLYRECRTREELLQLIGDRPLPVPPGRRVEYSSQGFILLGLLAEAATATGLDQLVRDRLCDPLGMHDTGFGARAQDSVATEQCPWRGRLIAGEVHDENAVVLGGVCGHAGLFSTLGDLELLARELLRGAPSLMRPETFALMTAPHTEGMNLHRCLAWQGLDLEGTPVGLAMTASAYGHTGFTGTSLWLDPRLGRYTILLTNRVHPTRNNPGFGDIRREFHDLVAELPG